MEGSFNVPFVNTTNGTKEAKVIIPKRAVATGECGAEKQMISISWTYNNNDIDMLNMTFEKNATSKKFMISSINGVISKNDHEFPNAKGNFYFAFFNFALYTSVFIHVV